MGTEKSDRRFSTIFHRQNNLILSRLNRLESFDEGKQELKVADKEAVSSERDFTDRQKNG